MKKILFLLVSLLLSMTLIGQTKTRVDDYIQYAPIAGIYIPGLFGMDSRSNFRDKTIVTASSFIVMAGAVNLIKHTVHSERPDKSANNSFPSGHTATAFTGAHLMHKEYGNIYLSLTAYSIATTTGVLRMVNKRHRSADVLAGAGIGILSVEFSYYLLPIIHKKLGINENIQIIPSYGSDFTGLNIALIL